MSSSCAGECDFPADPDTAADLQSLFWCPVIQPQAIVLSVAPSCDDVADNVITLAHLRGIDLRHAADGWHGIWQADGVAHQFWLPHASPDVAAFYAVSLPMDSFLELRAHAARRLWRAFNGRPPGPDFRSLPAQLRQWHILSLRAIDARFRGASYRAIAEVLFSFKGSKEDFEVDPRKNRARRLVAHGMRMMGGGYRRLLHYPLKLEQLRRKR